VHNCAALSAVRDVEKALENKDVAVLAQFGDVDMDAVALAIALHPIDDIEALCDHSEELGVAARRGDAEALAVLRRSVCGAALIQSRWKKSTKEEELRLTLLKVRLNAFPFAGGLALFRRGSGK
jgi:hypothetical protein